MSSSLHGNRSFAQSKRSKSCCEKDQEEQFKRIGKGISEAIIMRQPPIGNDEDENNEAEPEDEAEDLRHDEKSKADRKQQVLILLVFVATKF